MCGHKHRSGPSSLRHGDPLAGAADTADRRDPTSEPGAGSVALTPSPRPDLRISDAEREVTVLALRDHAGDGRLDVDELSERLDAAYAARTRGDLDVLLADLPILMPQRSAAAAPPTRSGRTHGRRRPRDREEVVSHVASYVGVCLLLVGIWFMTGADYFWPIWPILGWGIGVVSHAAPVFGGSSGCASRQRALTSSGRTAT